jgi:Chlorophyllase enzyme
MSIQLRGLFLVSTSLVLATACGDHVDTATMHSGRVAHSESFAHSAVSGNSDAAVLPSTMLPFDSPKEGGNVIPNPGLKEDPGNLSPPMMMSPIYPCGDRIGVKGFIPGAKITVSVNGSAVSSGTGWNADGEAFQVPPLVAGQVITATQEYAGVVSGAAGPVTVRDHHADFPSGLPLSRVHPPPLFACGHVTASRYHLPGARVEAFSRPSPGAGAYTFIGATTAITDYSAVAVSPDFTMGEAITTQYKVCSDVSSMSPEEIVQPEPNVVPAPVVDPDLYEEHDRVTVSNLLNGALVEVFVNGGFAGSSATATSTATVRLSAPLAAGQAVTATQKLCNGSSPSGQVGVLECKALPAPVIRPPENGATVVEVTESVPGARIIVFGADGHEIGDGGGGLVQLTRPVLPGERLLVLQQLGSCVSQWVYAVSGTCKDIRTVEDSSTSGPYGVGAADYSLPSVTVGSDVVRIQGTVRFPKDPAASGDVLVPYGGPRPLVVFLHGNHGTVRPPSGDDQCGGEGSEAPSFRGYDYVLESLARNGYIAVSINGNDLNCKDDRIDERAFLILQHLAAWKRFHDPMEPDPAFGGMFHGRVDLDHIGVAGHSRGGEAAVRSATLNGDPKLKIRAVLAIAPVDSHGFTLSGVPLYMVLPAADGDVIGNDGARIYDRAKAGDWSWWKAQSYIYGADHNQFNREWRVPDGSGPDLRTRAEQEAMLRTWARTFFDVWLQGETQHTRIFSGDALVSGIRNDRIYPSFESADALLVDSHEDGNETLNTLGGAVSSSFDVFKELPFDQRGSAYNESFFHDTSGLIARWEGSNKAFESEVPAAFADIARYRYLSFRVTQVNDPLNSSGGPISFRVHTVDAAGGGGPVQTSQVGEVPFPYASAPVGKSMMRTLRVPLTCFASEKGLLLDRTRVKAIKFDTDTLKTGVLGFDQVTFSN